MDRNGRVDVLYKALFDTRPYEVNQGETLAVYQRSLQRLSDALEFGENAYHAMEQSAEEFRGIKVDKSRKKPTIGIVGEIYVRTHGFCNESIIDKVEAREERSGWRFNGMDLLYQLYPYAPCKTESRIF
jgi:predicted nucleotide-binding protein (sugar kinase/HSP70/actin superfamily)